MSGLFSMPGPWWVRRQEYYRTELLFGVPYQDAWRWFYRPLRPECWKEQLPWYL